MTEENPVDVKPVYRSGVLGLNTSTERERLSGSIVRFVRSSKSGVSTYEQRILMAEKSLQEDDYLHDYA
jgi:hypothetical protein